MDWAKRFKEKMKYVTSESKREHELDLSWLGETPDGRWLLSEADSKWLYKHWGIRSKYELGETTTTRPER